MFGAPRDGVWLTDRNNRRAFERSYLEPRVMAEVSEPTLSVSLLADRVAMPIGLAPVGFLHRVHPEGEVAAARAAHAADVLTVLSTATSSPLDAVRAATKAPLWFQLYWFTDRELVRLLVERASAAPVSALMLTVDNVGSLTRERTSPQSARVGRIDVLPAVLGLDRPNLPTMDRIQDSLSTRISWRDIEWLRSITGLPILIKGILSASDAAIAVEHGIDGIVVSNHGGHAIPGAVATLDVLPRIVDVVGRAAEVLLDGGVRTGADVLKALALGAKAVLIGRPVYWGLAFDGEEGLRRVLEILRRELIAAMRMCGVSDVGHVSPSVIHRRGAAELVERLEQIATLERDGYISRAEFERLKADLIPGLSGGGG